MSTRLLDLLGRRVLVLDGAMGTSVHTHDLTVEGDYRGCENCTEVLVRSRPDVIQGIHESFLAAGCDAVETDSFGGMPHVLAEFGLQDESRAICKASAEIARGACEKFSTPERPRFVLGSLGPGTKLITLGNIGWDAMLASYRTAAAGLIEGGADALLIETCQDLLQVKCAINGCLAALDDAGKTPADVPLMVSVTIETTGTMLLGTTIEAAAVALRGYPIASLGLNCATGPAEMAEHIAHLARHWDRPISVVPNAGLPELKDGKTVYPLGPEPFATALDRYVREYGVAMVGGCCGTTPEHIARLVREMGGRGVGKVEKAARRGATTSLYSVVEHRQDSSFLIVAERMNASGSRKFKGLLEADQWDGMVSLAREQVRTDGAHVLDINVDYAGRDNAADMAELVRRVVRQVDAPLMIDSTQLATLEAGLQSAGGKCVINSANFEDGPGKFDAICRLAKTYGSAIVIGSIDEDKENAMARTADRKLSIAQRARDRAVELHGLDPADLFFDPLVLPVSTGMETDRRSAMATIEGARLIAAAMPECQLTAGVSNVSFGLAPAARVVLNSAFMHELLEAGLTSAIVNASKILPRNRIGDDQWEAALAVIYDRRAQSRGGTGLPGGVADEDFDPLAAFIDLFRDATAATAAAKPRKEMTLGERLRSHIIDGEKDGVRETLDEAMRQWSPIEIINDHLLDGMKTVGELFGSGQMQLPFVLQSAEVMKMAVSHLEPHMERVAGQSQSKGKIVLATVKGDVHDIGKNLVDIILSNNGYTVFNLGIKQPIAGILAAWREHRADAIGLSGLLVKSVNVMEENLKEMNEESIDVPVLLGGAALSRHYAEGRLRSLYRGKLYYGKDAFEGLRIMERIAGRKTGELDSEIETRLQKRSDAEVVIAGARAERAAREEAAQGGGVAQSAAGAAVATFPAAVVSGVARDGPVPTPPFWGSLLVEAIDLDEVYPYINTVALFRGQWQFKKGAMSDDDYRTLLRDTVEPEFARLKQQCKDGAILRPAVVYGYFPCQSEGDDLIVYDPADHDREVERFRFPRQEGRKRLCISDFFRSVESGVRDTLAMTCVTVGAEASRVTRALFDRNDYTQYLYTHGLSVETAEALAELWHKRIREELGIAGEDDPDVRGLFVQRYRGSRYSFGYPACPDMSDQEKLFRLLRPERIGCALTENWQIDPEQSTSAIVVHHPEAKYFAV